MDGLTGITLEGVLSATVRMAAPLLLVSLGGLFTARAGIINLALEGIMLMGAFTAFAGAYLSGSLAVGLVSAMLGGTLTAMILGFLAINARANQTVAGVGINIAALGLTSYLFKVYFTGQGLLKGPTFNQIAIPVLSEIPVVGPALFDQNLLTYLAFIMVPVVWYVLYKTPIGLTIRATGEHPKAVDTLGGNVTLIRYSCIIIMGCLVGIGGACLTIGQSGVFAENITAGKGYISLAIIIFGGFTPFGILGAAILFGFSEGLQLRLQTAGSPIPHQFLTMLPYILTLIALISFAGKSRAPAAIGKPYKRQG